MRWVLAAVLTLALVPATASAAPTTTGTLYVQQAANATLLRAGGGWKLVLDRPDAYVIAFADRPVRTGTAMRVTSFVHAWDAAFGGDPPNAALEIAGAPASRDVALVELSAPRLSSGGRRLTYRARPLTATSATLGGLARRADRGISGRLGRVTLFIDDGAGGGAGVLTMSVTNITPGTTASVSPLILVPGAAASFSTTTQDTSYAVISNAPMIACAAGAPAPCAGTLVVDVAPSFAPTDQPLSAMLAIDQVAQATLAWSGGAPQTFSGPQPITLSPGS